MMRRSIVAAKEYAASTLLIPRPLNSARPTSLHPHRRHHRHHPQLYASPMRRSSTKRIIQTNKNEHPSNPSSSSSLCVIKLFYSTPKSSASPLKSWFLIPPLSTFTPFFIYSVLF